MEKQSIKSDEVTTVAELKNHVQVFVAERDWTKYHSPKNLATSIAIEAAELMELYQWVSDKEAGKILRDKRKYRELEEELADIIIYCLSLASVANIDVSRAVISKIDRNRTKYPVERVKGDYKKYTEL